MRNSKKVLALTLGAVVLSLGLGALTACGGTAQGGKTDDGKTEENSVAGTYSVTYTKEQLSGNVRHTGYLTALGVHETNTVVLKSDNTYEYTKLVTNAPDGNSAEAETDVKVYSVKLYSDETSTAESGALFSWTSAGDGNCTLDCYADGTYKFTFISYGMTETGKWTWSGWTFKLTPDGGQEITATMDESHALNIHYVAVAGGGALTHDFKCDSSVWAAALGQTGSYTPTESGKTDEAPVYYTGSGKKTGGGVEYDVTVHMFLLQSGKVYFVEATETNSTKSVGSWKEENGSISVAVGDETASIKDDKLSIDGIELSLSDSIPAEYKSADFDALIKEAETPVVYSQYITITYTFKGTYTADGNTVTLSPATSCVWSEDWASLQARGFTNCNGTEKDKVYPKGETGEFYIPLDHFGGPYYFASNGTETVTNNNAQKIKVSADGTFEYIIESIFD